MVSDFQKLHLQIYASQCMTSLIIPLPFALLNLAKVERKMKKYKSLNIWREWKELFRWSKNIFKVFEVLSFGEKIKKLIKMADTSFKLIFDYCCCSCFYFYVYFYYLKLYFLSLWILMSEIKFDLTWLDHSLLDNTRFSLTQNFAVWQYYF